MVLRSTFPSMYTAPLSVAVASRDASIYLFNCIFLMGIRPLPKRLTLRLLYVVWSFALNLFSTFYQPIGFLTSYVIHMSEFSPSAFLTSAQVAFNAWACSTKVIILWLRVHYLDMANEVLDELDKRCVTNDEKQKIRHSVALSNRIFFFYMVVYMCYATSTFISGVIDGRPPYQNYYPFIDWRSNSMNFWLQSSFEYFAMAGACFQDVCVDCYSINYVMMLRTHVHILTERVRDLGTNPKLTSNDTYEELIKCIMDHKTILKCSKKIHVLISGTIFVQFLVVGIVMGLTLINIMLFADLYSAIGSLSFLCAVSLETIPICVLCNLLVADCEELADAVFQSNWIDKQQRYKKTLLHFLHNVQQPIVFTAMNVFPVSVATNINFTKFAFSVFTLVKQMNIAERFFKEV